MQDDDEGGDAVIMIVMVMVIVIITTMTTMIHSNRDVCGMADDIITNKFHHISHLVRTEDVDDDINMI